ncbi:copper amine oxidase [Paenibacillus sp. GbtcB18]|uniref:RCC1 domain-containing protein n=1 Tax=Paenibacillus sp. GbtcB18 TaxID=2824763 RepID=UPI0020C68421|nr:copper amine oxidase [Paenibacillus sp. GbtcB18]
MNTFKKRFWNVIAKNRMHTAALISVLTLASSPIPASAAINVYDSLLSAGESTTFLVKSDGSAFYAAGSNASGKLGYTGSTSNQTVPVQSVGTDIAMVDAGLSHSVLLRKDGTIWSWGSATYGETGTGLKTGVSNPPVQNVFLNNVKEVRAGNNFTLALKQDGTVWAYGKNSDGQLGIGTKDYSLKPLQVLGISDIVAIDAGDDFGAALSSDGSLWVWGNGAYGALGQGDKADQLLPVRYPLDNVQDFAVGSDRIYVLADGFLYGSGSNTSGKLGDGTTTTRLSPTFINISNVADIDAGDTQTLVLKTDGTVWAWGQNTNGEVGDGTKQNAKVPVQVIDTSALPLTDVIAIDAGGTHSHALKADGTLWSWGSNASGQLGTGNSVSERFASRSKFPNPFR